MDITWAVLLVIVLLIGWTLNLFGLPGNWLNVVATLVYALLIPPTAGRVSVGWIVVAAVIGLALLGEVIEFVAGAAGAKKAGGSRRGAVLALVGGLVGAIVGMFVGIPIPVVGSILAALLFAGVGSLAGAILGETWAGRDAQHSWEVGKAAFWGRLLGTLGKILVGSFVVSVVLAALVFEGI
ncbi:MAG: DUF456 domain-containing protein [Planctomycetes bacterium]|nr:DUF456 domain-containing protein [Planctomycetota bacterium]